jgi:mannonate dehydratase
MAAEMRLAVGGVTEITDEILGFAAQLGASGLQIWPARRSGPQHWTTEELVEARNRCESHGLRLEAVAMHIYVRAMLGLPGGEAEIEDCIRTVRAMGRAGVRIIGHDWNPNGVWRTAQAMPWRGGSTVSAFDQSVIDRADATGSNRLFGTYPDPVYEAVNELPPDHIVTEDEMWGHFRKFMRAVLPIAEEEGVVLAVHPDDPPSPMLGGIARILRSPAHYRKAFEVADSPALHVLACLGTISEMEGGPAAVEEMIDTFAPQGRIAYVHFRNVQGTVPRFNECYLGEGNYEPIKVMRRLRSMGFTGFLIDDHVPTMPGDSLWGSRARAHAMGYLQALIRATSVEPNQPAT